MADGTRRIVLSCRASGISAPLGTMQITVTTGLSTQGATRTSGTIRGTSEAVPMGDMLEVGNASNIRGTGSLDQEST
jgi:hypothetical protein